MDKVYFFDSILIQLPFTQILRRLGFQHTVSELTEEQKKTYLNLAQLAFDHCTLKGCARQVSLDYSNSEIIFANQFRIKSESLKKFLGHNQQALLLAATAGSRISEAIKEKMLKNKLDEASVFDACASELVDKALDWIIHWFNNNNLKRNLLLAGKRRYSCGYGDFTLENQTLFYKLLELPKLDISLTGDYILIPEKTVTALALIKKIG